MTTTSPQGRGFFMTLEGVDGAGKSTHLSWLLDTLRARGLPVLATREPGGTPLGEQCREWLLHQPMTLRTETLLMFAARCEHLETVIRPALGQGKWVVCDRFTDATYAYQGGGRQLGEAPVRALEQWVQGDLQPDCTWLFDLPLEIARQRLAGARDPDRFEREDAAFFERTRKAYLVRAREHPERIRIIDASQDVAGVRHQLAEALESVLRAGVGCE